MKQIIHTEGIVVKTSDYKEQAVIATVLTKDGTKNYIIRGAKKITSGTRLLAVPLTKITFHATQTDGLDTITEGMVQNTFNNIKGDINKMMVVYAILEKILVFSKQVTNNNTFYNFVTSTIQKIDEGLDEETLLSIFELKLTYLIGIAPELKQCIHCSQKTEHPYFSILHGGIRCERCGGSSSYDLNESETKTLQLLYLVKLDKVDDNFIKVVQPNISKISTIIDAYYNSYLDFISKAKQVKKSIS